MGSAFVAFLSIGLLIIVSLILLFSLLRALIFFGTMAFGAPYVASRPDAIKQLLSLARLKAGERAIDLGSGDGRVVLALTQSGVKATGIEINPLLVRQSRALIKQARTATDEVSWESPHIIQGSLWTHDLSKYDVVFFYGTTYMLPGLAKKFAREVKPGARIVSNYFALPGWNVRESRDALKLYLRDDQR